jgi:hypothetical protein
MYWTLTNGLRTARAEGNQELADEHAGELADMAIQSPFVTIRHRAQAFLANNGYPKLYESVLTQYRVNEFLDASPDLNFTLPQTDNGTEAPCGS